MLVLLLPACTGEKDEAQIPVPAPTTGSLKLELIHEVDDKPLAYDTLLYINAAGNRYSVTRLFYYLSAFRFVPVSGATVYTRDVFYVDASRKQDILLTGIPAGFYKGFQPVIGIDAALNVHGKLTNSIENINMLWPDEMGGGYHFLKLEGRYDNAQKQINGFSVHLGTNEALVNHQFIPLTFEVSEGKITTIRLFMNLNEWFANDYQFDFNKDGNYTMGIAGLMKLVANNGKDVLTAK